MGWQQWIFRMLDTCFFRDGLPYNKGEGGYTQAQSIFPPYMTTLQGAIRAQLAFARGWRPGWPQKWPPELGGSEEPGNLRFLGPYICWQSDLLFPMPLYVLVKEETTPDKATKRFFLVRLAPGEPVTCDLGENVRLPRPDRPIAGARIPEGLYLTKKGLEALLNYDFPGWEQVKTQGELWEEEPHIGLERQDDTRTALDTMLYRAIHIRSLPGVKLVVLVDGIPEDWSQATTTAVTVGGEGRVAEVEVQSFAGTDSRNLLPALPNLAPEEDGRLLFTVTLITPGCYEDPERVILEGPPGVPGRCVSACLGRAAQAGGWDLALDRPRPLIPILPAGSTWFFQGSARDMKEVSDLHGRCLGSRTYFGFGQVVIGKWKEER